MLIYVILMTPPYAKKWERHATIDTFQILNQQCMLQVSKIPAALIGSTMKIELSALVMALDTDLISS